MSAAAVLPAKRELTIKCRLVMFGHFPSLKKQFVREKDVVLKGVKEGTSVGDIKKTLAEICFDDTRRPGSVSFNIMGQRYEEVKSTFIGGDSKTDPPFKEMHVTFDGKDVKLYTQQSIRKYRPFDPLKSCHKLYVNQDLSIKVTSTVKNKKMSPIKSEMKKRKEAAWSGHIFVKNLLGKTIRLDVSSLFTFEDVKKLIHREATWPHQLRLVFNGKRLDERRTLEDYNLTKGATLSLVLSLRGGMYDPSSARHDLESLRTKKAVTILLKMSGFCGIDSMEIQCPTSDLSTATLKKRLQKIAAVALAS